MSTGSAAGIGLFAFVAGFVLAVCMAGKSIDNYAERGWLTANGKVYVITPAKVQKETP